MSDWKIAVAVSALLAVLAGVAAFMLWPSTPEIPVKPPVTRAAVLPPPPPPPELPAAEPSSAVPTLVEAATEDIDARVKALAGEMGRMWTRNPEELVRVIESASRQASASPSVTLLLAIAHAETNGKILDVSEAGAVGLAQATPIACRQEEMGGLLYITNDYLVGARAYITKKPLGDADTIASLIVARDDEKTRKKAKRLLGSAFDLRLEGVDELELLEPYAKQRFFQELQVAKIHNLKTLRELERLLDHGSRAQIRAFRDRTRREYRDLKKLQMEGWRRYQLDLMAKRDEALEKHYGRPAIEIKKTMPYEAGEYLSTVLDQRFSGRQMAEFLVRHLDRKAGEARQLARRNDNVEEMTAALYNGGSHNVKRMLAGLIASLPETQKYMKKVPATRRRLDTTIASIDDPRKKHVAR